MRSDSIDREANYIYGRLRSAYPSWDPRANGYISPGFFYRERALVHALIKDLGKSEERVLDIACGSGLMFAVTPVHPEHWPGDVFGLDFNGAACRSAQDLGYHVVRGDAFALPLADASVALAVNSQFLQQQSADEVTRFFLEVARILSPGGHLILTWRSGSWLHSAANSIVETRDRLFRRKPVIHMKHHLAWTRHCAARAGLITETAGRTLAFGGHTLVSEGSLLGRSVGASNCLVLRKEDGAADGRDDAG